MVKKWSDVAESAEFKELPDDDKDVVREAYFERVVAPEVAPEELEATREQFARASGLRSRSLPKGVKPSSAGGGRGTVNRPSAVEQPTATPEAPPQPFSDPMGTDAAAGIVDPNEPTAPTSVLDRAASPSTSAYNNTPLEAAAGMTIRPGAEQAVRERLVADGRLSGGPRGEMRATPPEVAAGMELRNATRGRIGLAHLGSAGLGVAGGLAEIGKAGPGALAAAADMVGADGVSEFAQGAVKRANAFQQASQPAAEGFDKNVAAIFSSITANLPTMVTGVAGQGPALAQMFVQTASANYGELRSEGFKPLPSAAASVINSGAEVLGERFGFKEQTIAVKGLMTRMMRHGASTDDMAKNAAKLLVKELPGEELTTTIQFLNEKYGFAPRTPEATLQDYFKQVADTAITTMGQSAVVGGSPAAIDAAKKVRDKAELAINQAAGLVPKGPYRDAAEKGFVVDPPLVTDTPLAQRAKTLKIFESAAAEVGLDEVAVKRAKAATSGMPAKDVGPFLNELLAVLQGKGAVATPVPEHVASALSAGAVAPMTEAEIAGIEAAPTKIEADTKPIEADEDLTGLSESTPPSPLDEAAHAAATSPHNDLAEPTPAQAEAGNYAKGHFKIAGMDLSIENPEGSVRKDMKNVPPKWQHDMTAHYGYIRGTVGQDGDHIDAFIKPGTAPDHQGDVYVIDQLHADGAPDEHKVMVGYDSADAARAAYLAHYPKGWKGLGAITAAPVDQFKAWLKDGDTQKPFAQGQNAAHEQPDLRVSPELAQSPAEEGGHQPAGSGRAVGPLADGKAGRVEPISQAPAPSVREAAPVRGGSGDQATVAGGRIIARLGPMPKTATPLELRPNKDGTSTPWHDGYEMVDFDSGEPIKIPAGATDRQALDAIKEAGALSRRMKVFANKEEIDTSAERVETASNQEAKPEAKGPGRAAVASKTAKARMAFNPETDSVLQALAKMGGLQREAAAKEFGLRPEELKHQVRAGNLNAYPFRVTGGMGMDSAISTLQEAGYFPGVPADQVRGALEAALHDELGGKATLTPTGQMRQAEQAHNEHQALAGGAQAEREGLMDEAGLSESDMAALSDDDIDLDGQSNTSTEAFMRSMGFSDQEIADETAKQAREAQAGADEAGAPASAKPGSVARSGSAEARAQPAAAAGPGGRRAAEPRRKLSESEAFADDYAAFEGRTLVQPVLLADSGETATLKLDAAKAMRSLDAREKALKGLLDCLRKAA